MQLVISNINNYLKEFSNTISKSPELTFDLSNISDIDSAGLAFLLELKKLAKQANCSLKFINSNDQVERLCQLYKISL